MNFKSLGRIFLSGLFTILPILVTLFILIWFATFANDVFKVFIPNKLYWPGMGLLFGLVLIFVIGLLMNAWIGQRIFNLGDTLLNRIPIVKTLYGSSRDLMNLLSGSEKKKFSRVVVVRLGRVRVIGLVTRESLADLPENLAAADSVVVYIPLSYQIGGHMVILPRASIEPLSMSLEEAMRFILTAGVSKKPVAAARGEENGLLP